MKSLSDPPPPPLAADVTLSSLQCRAASENICVACSQLLSLIRTLRLSLLLMDGETMEAEEFLQVEYAQQRTAEIMANIARLEEELTQVRSNNSNNNSTTTGNGTLRG